MTTYLHCVFTDRHLTHCEEIRRAMCEDCEAELVEFNGEANRVHLLINFPPSSRTAALALAEVNPADPCAQLRSERAMDSLHHRAEGLC
uniref:Transposase n=1 Tax=Streptomyces sp. NBC_00180 TaxID=2903632 RepID=A0AAU1I9S6_9ACTN